MKEYNIEDYLNPELSKEIIEELVKENAELKAENKRLEELKCKFKEYYCTCNTEKYVQCLQEIKEIVEGIRNATYQFGQEADQKFFNETLGKILQIITKAEVGE